MHGARFDGEGKVTVLSDTEVAELTEKIKQRTVCRFFETPTDSLVDYDKLPPADSLKCYTPEEYRALITPDAGVSSNR